MEFRPTPRLLALLFSLLFIPPAFSQEIRNVTVGWGNSLRLGRWTPVFVTVEDAQPREIDLQIHGSYGEKSAALWLHQTAVAEPRPDAAQRRHRREKPVEKGRAHFILCPLFAVAG